MNFSKIQKYLHFDMNKDKHRIQKNGYLIIDLTTRIISDFLSESRPDIHLSFSRKHKIVQEKIH
jgi:hypothetical protein